MKNDKQEPMSFFDYVIMVVVSAFILGTFKGFKNDD